MSSAETDFKDDELCTRTSWVNAEVAYDLLRKGEINGDKYALLVRKHLQRALFNLGCCIQHHAGKVVFIGLLLLTLCCIGLKSATLETDLQKLWSEDGGRLTKELEYTRKKHGNPGGTSIELLIQTSKGGANILTTKSLFTHLEKILKAFKIKVQHIDSKSKTVTSWSLRDICYIPSIPQFESSLIEMIIEKLMPCVILTPLDCFWEGSLIHSIQPVHAPILGKISWKNVNPKELLDKFGLGGINIGTFNLAEARSLFNETGVTSGYVKKPCLNPRDPECPITAPNKLSGRPPDLGATLSDGCTGISTKYMHWNRELIVGGTTLNKSRNIISAAGFQSVIMIIESYQLYSLYKTHPKVSHIDWSTSVASQILKQWQRAFYQEMTKSPENSTDEFFAFTETSLYDILIKYSSTDTIQVALGYIFMAIYACISLMKFNDGIRSQSTVGFIGVLLVALSVAAGLGMSSLLGIHMNASTTQIIPFLALGIGVDDMFVIAHTYSESSYGSSFAERTGECLRKVGVTVVLTSLTIMIAFFCCAIIPIPALRSFSIQAGILSFFNLSSLLLIYPAIMSLDLRRQESGRIDFFCCLKVLDRNEHRNTDSIHNHPMTVSSPAPLVYSNIPSDNNAARDGNTGREYEMRHPAQNSSHNVQYVDIQLNLSDNDHNKPINASHSASLKSVVPLPIQQNIMQLDNHLVHQQSVVAHISVPSQRSTTSTNINWNALKKISIKWDITYFVSNYYGPLLQKVVTKVCVILAFVVLLTFGALGVLKVTDGLELTDVMPRNTKMYGFLERQQKFFSFYNVFIITKNVDYPGRQKELFDLHESFGKVKRILKKKGGKLQPFWLILFRDWLKDLQYNFDQDLRNGKINGSRSVGASEKGSLAHHLLSQTGEDDNPFDYSQITKIRLVEDNGIIYPPAFYNYLSAWATIELFSYDTSFAGLHPSPAKWRFEPKNPTKVPKSSPITFGQMPFFIHDVAAMEDMMDTIKTMRSICDNYTKIGIGTYPRGVPFTYWEQYIKLRQYLLFTLILIVVAVFVIISIILVNVWLAAVNVIVILCVTVELFGAMGWMGIKLSAIPAVILIVSVGIGVEFTVHISMAFITSIGNRNHRMWRSLKHAFSPVLHGILSTFLGIIMLSRSEFDFIVKYFFYVLLCLMILGVVNGLMFLPVLLSLIGPRAEVRPKDGGNCISVSLSPLSPQTNKRRSSDKNTNRPQLSTISEESSQNSSAHISSSPQDVRNNFATTVRPASVQSNRSTGESTCSSPVTRVTATTTVMVEIHTNLPEHSQGQERGDIIRSDVRSFPKQSECSDGEHCYKSKRRKAHSFT